MKTMTLDQAIESLNVMSKKLESLDMQVTDGHGCGTRKITLSGLALHTAGTGGYEIVALHDASYFTLNPVTAMGDGLRMSKWAHGGTFVPSDEVEHAIISYNNSLTFGGGIVALWTPEGGLTAGFETGQGVLVS